MAVLDTEDDELHLVFTQRERAILSQHFPQAFLDGLERVDWSLQESFAHLNDAYLNSFAGMAHARTDIERHHAFSEVLANIGIEREQQQQSFDSQPPPPPNAARPIA
ncbi:hypothetical protein PPROV_000076100 [Pycnococcus provasolii]|uniref:Uncharacterized protein n=1 Tax=Pycnococcus provasolii TaxID=41880 RepID=A0A830H4P3_9CHLO|nr:hypothetical protein PPROV_000076100 [Pycnococcus provasolii]